MDIINEDFNILKQIICMKMLKYKIDMTLCSLYCNNDVENKLHIVKNFKKSITEIVANDFKNL